LAEAAGPARIAIIGVGGMGIAHYHAQAFLDTGRARIAGICDVKPEALEAFGERFAVPAGRRYADHRAMLAEVRPEIVVVCTNETLHARLSIEAATYRPRAVLCEKPMAMNLGEADAMLEAAARHGVTLLVGHQRRYMPQYARARELLRAGAIGTLQHIQAMGHPGSALLVDGTHAMDLVRFYAEDAPAEWVIGQVDARTRRAGWGHVLEDAAVALVKFAGGVRAWLTTGGAGATPVREGLGEPVTGPHYHRILLHGTRGRIEIAGDAAGEGEPLVRVIADHRAEAVDCGPGPWHRGLSPQGELLQALEDGHPHPLEARGARATLEILMAVYESARLGGLVPLPLANGGNPLEQMLAERADAGAPARA
jgi:predicted dehydrogenase